MKLKPDFKSINFKTFAYFVLFAAALMLLLWTLQVLFLNNFYGIMKSSQTKVVAKELQQSYNTYGGSQSEEFKQDAEDLARSYDMDIFVVSYTSGIGINISNSPGIDSRNNYKPIMISLYNEIQSGTTGSAHMGHQDIEGLVTSEEDQSESQENRGPRPEIFEDDVPKKVFAYGTVLNKYDSGADFEDAEVLYIFSPLRPVTSTQRIMTTILIYVTIISLALAMILSIYLSTRITRPIRQITGSAERLAHGEYGVVFKGGHYTEINQLADTLNAASFELEKSDMLQKDLVANVSHDLRTPLTMIRSYAEMIRDISGDNKEKREAHLQVIMDESDRLNALVEDLLTVSRLQSGKLTIEKKDFNLSEALRSITNTYGIMEEESGYHINVDCPADFIVNGDEEKIKQVLTNLITNAIKFSGDDKVVDISLKRKGRSVRCSVSDHGPGIASEDLEHIWERYYRSSSNMVRASEGSGLGLSIVKEILSLHKSAFGVDSTLGYGSTFWFDLPLVKSEKTGKSEKPEMTKPEN